MKTVVLLAVPVLAAVTIAVLFQAFRSGASSAVMPPGGAAPAVAGVVPGVVDAAAARRLVAAGVKVVDVRTPAEFAAGHVAGAVNIPFDEVAQRAGEIGEPSTPVLLYCRSGRRSAIARKTLGELGFAQVYDFEAYDRWVASERAAGR